MLSNYQKAKYAVKNLTEGQLEDLAVYMDQLLDELDDKCQNLTTKS